LEADASRYHGKAPDEIDWSAPERQTRAVAEFLSGLDDQDPNPDRKPPKVISPTDPCSAWTAKANKRVQFGYGLNYLIDIKNAVIVDGRTKACTLYASLLADEKCERNCIALEAVSSRPEIQCRGEGAPVVIPTRFTEDVRADFRAQNRLDFRRIVRIGVGMGWLSQSRPGLALRFAGLWVVRASSPAPRTNGA
jgi:hypothetical protein